MLPLLILWPGIVVLLLVLGAQAFLVTGARAQADAAASEGLRAVWAAVGDAGLAHADDGSAYIGAEPHPRTAAMSATAQDAVALAASGSAGGWRWWTPGAVTVRSDWCHSGTGAGLRPGPGESGWVRVTVSGDVFGPFSALWPGRLDRVHASAAGPAVLLLPAAAEPTGPGGDPGSVTAELPEC
ncbi:MAG: hypothetical protein F4Y76_00805 [Acidimicrobiales bacterium]|nr:hypothetical protein [Acidimicrobiales bacterium]MYG61757.1 hypothetical protein [Acidimicrobiales bacterium]MYJ47895.1 hypothetical protein [Acidimicrobiales bacterium]